MQLRHWFLPVCLAGFSVSVFSQTPQKPASQPPKKESSAAAPEKTAGEAFKNVQVLKEIPASQFMPNMFFITEALGVGCEHCHVTSDSGPWPLEKDDKKEKQTARDMIKMMRSINDQFFSGQLEVTCATCHRGHPEPDHLPPLRPLGVKPAEEPEANLKDLPTADQILDSYVEAIGGHAALEKLTTRKIKGVLVGESGRTYPLEVTEKAPNLGLVSITFANGTVNRDGFDGSTAWDSAGENAFESQGLEAARIARDAQLFADTDVKKRYPRRFTAGKESVGDEECFVVRAGGPGRVSEKLSFSVKTGLLLRHVIFTRTEVGRFVEQTDYSDYRQVDGVKLPFTIARNEVNTRYTEKYSEIKHNVPVDDSIFKFPAPSK
jgi:photosynthetic reaction center cytochrome c subunit